MRTISVYRFGRWPSSHDLDLLVTYTDGAPIITEADMTKFGVDLCDMLRRGATPTAAAVTPSDVGLASLAPLFNRLLIEHGVPLDVFLGTPKEDFDFVPALWVTGPDDWQLDWRPVGGDFFIFAEPMTTAREAAQR